MNVKRMEKLASLLDSLSRRKLDMTTWFRPSDKLILDEKPLICEADVRNDCGTTCCIAGWAVLSAGKCFNSQHSYVANPSGRPVRSGEVRRVYARDFAQKYLGLDEWQATSLFYDFSLSTPQQAAAKIRSMLPEAR